MRSNEAIRKKETLDTITELIDDKVDKLAVIMRHSARHFHQDAAMEPFMGLTETGKDHALELGMLLPLKPYPRFLSSHFGRCIETACLIDKGYSKAHGRFNGHNLLAEELSPFYVQDINRAVTMVSELGSLMFIRNWFDKKIPRGIMQAPEKTADTIARFLTDQLGALEAGRIVVCVSHDWNMYPLKEYKLGLKHEDYGTVGFLESVILFEKNGKHYITNYQKAPQVLA